MGFNVRANPAGFRAVPGCGPALCEVPWEAQGGIVPSAAAQPGPADRAAGGSRQGFTALYFLV